MPAAPTRANAPVGRGPAGARPVLELAVAPEREAVAEPDSEAVPNPDAVREAETSGEPDPLDALTTATV